MKSTHPCRTLDENESTFTLAYKNPFGKRRQWRKTRNYRIKFTQLNNLLSSVPLSSRKAWNSPPPPNHRLSYVALKKAHSKNSYIVPTVQDSIRELPTRTPLRPWKTLRAPQKKNWGRWIQSHEQVSNRTKIKYEHIKRNILSLAQNASLNKS